MSFCSELNAKLDTIITALGDMAACCGSAGVIYGNPPDYSLDGTGLVPQAVVDAGYASDTSDWTGYADYKCMAAHILVENLKATVDSFGSLVETAGITLVKVAGVLASAWFAWITGGASIVILGKFVVSDFIIWEALEALGTWVAADLHDLVADIEAIREDIVCAALNADGLYAIKSDVDDVLDANLSATAATLVKLANTQTKINAFFAPVYGDVDVAAWLADYGADTADYDCSCEGEPFAAISSIHPYAVCNTHSLYDDVAEGEEIQMQSNGEYATSHWVQFTFAQPGMAGIWTGAKDIVCTEITGWSAEASYNERILLYNSGSYPYVGGDAEPSEWTPGTPPFTVMTGTSRAGFKIRSNTAFTMTCKVVTTP